MIDFGIGDELELVRETARNFAADHLRPSMREHESARAVALRASGAFETIGFASLEWPESLGGSALGALARCVVAEELAAGDAGAALALDPLGPALYALLELGGTDALREFGLPLLETRGSRALLVWNGAGARTRLVRGPTGVSGRLAWVPANHVDLLVVLDEQGAFAVSDDIEHTPLRGAGLRTAGAVELSLDAAPLRAEWNDPAGAARALARARLYVASLLVGVMRESADFSRQYALDRVAFGKPIAHHQALSFLIADMAAAVDCARLLVWDAAWRLEVKEDAREACATAFVEASEQAMFVTPNGVQILGGHGFMQDYPVEKFMRDARALSLLFGGVDPAREAAGRELASTPDRVSLSVEAV